MPDAPPTLPGYAHVYSGKVRDLYAPVDPSSGAPRSDRLLLVASDRISAYDFVLDTPIPDKGEVLTRLSLWWFAQLEDLVPNHVVTADVPDAVRGRAVLVERLEMLPVECVARAYLTGGGLGEYTATGAVSGIPLPAGLVDGDRLEEPIFTPSTKAPVGEHDEPIPYEVVEAQLGAPLAARVRDLTVAILRRGNEIAAARGILLADTKVEFGLRGDEVVLADEVLTPGLVAVLARRPVGAGAPPAELRQAVRARLAHLAGIRLVAGVGGGAAAAARRRRRADPRQVRRGLRAAHRRDLLTSPRPCSAAASRRTCSVHDAIAVSAAARSPVTATSKSSPRAMASDCSARVPARSGGRPRATKESRSAVVQPVRSHSRSPAACGAPRMACVDSSKKSGANTAARSATLVQKAAPASNGSRSLLASSTSAACSACSTASTTAASRPSREPKW